MTQESDCLSGFLPSKPYGLDDQWQCESPCAVTMERYNYSFRLKVQLNIYNGATSSSNLQAAAIF